MLYNVVGSLFIICDSKLCAIFKYLAPLNQVVSSSHRKIGVQLLPKLDIVNYLK